VNAGDAARAAAALDTWFDDGSPWARAGRTWEQRDLEGMHAALEAPTVDAALEALTGCPPGTWLTTPEQDERNRAAMAGLRRRLGRGDTARPGPEMEL
jgi:hypothetical protein